jgi:hypothetical protein
VNAEVEELLSGSASGVLPGAWAARLADALGETEREARSKIAEIVRHIGIDEVRAIYARTLQVEAEGGMWLERHGRRRSIGGVFFVLAGQSPALVAYRRERFRERKKKRAAKIAEARKSGQSPELLQVELDRRRRKRQRRAARKAAARVQ